VAEKARRVAALGYDLMSVPDHLTDGLVAPLPVLVAAAAATERLQLATNVLNTDLRHPVVLARETATVDLLADGRFQLRLGHGEHRAGILAGGVGFRFG
jgi:alkanesulfonate monooxygenase SsuD/methylene tetrahydromethanopterin reductase-like flavin-dependent oxidoreductase (luciferase family)